MDHRAPLPKSRNGDIFTKLDRNDELIVRMQHAMLSGAQQQALELEELRKRDQQRQLDVPTTSSATKAKVIGVGISAVLVGLVNAAIQHKWFERPHEPDPKQSPIPVSTYR